MDRDSTLLSALPPSPAQVRFALVVGLLLFIAFVATIPFTNVSLAPVTAFIPVVDMALFLNDMLTCSLLYAQFSFTGSRGVLALACGFLFTALIIIPHALTYPGAFAPTGLLGANLDSTVWLYVFWHLSVPLVVIAYTLLKHQEGKLRSIQNSRRKSIVASVVLVAALACTLTWLATGGAAILPPIMIDTVRPRPPFVIILAVPLLAVSMLSIALLWWRRSSVLDLWLLVVLWAWLIEIILLSTAAYRYSVGWYAGRLYGLLSSCFVLFVLLSESMVIYPQLAISALGRRREQEGRLLMLGAMSAAIAHEINQPLTGIVSNGNAGLRFLKKRNLEKVEAVLRDIVSDGHRAGEIIEAVRATSNKGLRRGTVLDINEVAREVFVLLRPELQKNHVSLASDLREGLPRVLIDRVQLHQVMWNLAMNAIEAMSAVTDRRRTLVVRSEPRSPAAVAITVEDSGVGIDPKDIESIFDPFYTTKAHGMGMGLAICRSIVESYGGQLSVASARPHGSVFRVVLPVAPLNDMELQPVEPVIGDGASLA